MCFSNKLYTRSGLHRESSDQNPSFLVLQVVYIQLSSIKRDEVADPNVPRAEFFSHSIAAGENEVFFLFKEKIESLQPVDDYAFGVLSLVDPVSAKNQDLSLVEEILYWLIKVQVHANHRKQPEFVSLLRDHVQRENLVHSLAIEFLIHFIEEPLSVV